MSAKKTSAGKWIALVVALFCMFATGLIAPPAGLSQAGFQVLGILVGAIILFLSWGTGWPSMAIIFALMTVPGLSVSQVTQATFGNNTVVFLMFCMMLAACLTKSGAARRIAVWFLTNNLARKSPWWTVIMYFTANFVLNYVLSTAATIFVMLPIAVELLESVGVKKEQKAPIAVAIMLGTLVTGLLSNGGNPISHATTLQGFSFYESFTGEAMDFFTYCAIGTPIAIVSFLLFFFMVRFIWRPDVSMLTGINYEALKSTVGPMTKKEKYSIFFYIVCVILWMMPGLSEYVWPASAELFNKINNCLPPLAALFLMNFIKVDGEPVLAWGEAVKSVNWPSFMFIASIMGLGSFMGNANIGIPDWMSQVLAPVFSNISPFVFLVIMVLLADLMTNFTSNTVTVSVMLAVAMPLAMGVYEGQISVFLVAALVTSAANNGWTTPPASPTAAVVYGSDWVDTKSMIVWGLLAMVLHVIVTMTLGYALGSVLL
ncbi:MAG: SLC13 family permease [Oscillospiraceae bacterium]|nr:SLC13 family permease [Oscillospiraceae bacterium]